LQTQGKSIREIARILGIARNTVRRYLRGKPEAVPRPKRGSVLDAYKAQIRRWIQEDHLYNCETMLPRLQEQGYTGSLSTLRAFVHGLRPAQAGQYPVLRYETRPGEQMQYDWGEFHYEKDGKEHKLYGFAAILSYSRMRFITFVKRCDTPTMIRCMMEAFEYFGGLPKAALTDRMKSVFLLEMEDKTPKWNPVFSDFMACLGIAPRVCKARTPQTKGKIERSVGIIKGGFWPGVRFTDIDELNAQARLWCDRLNQRVHRTAPGAAGPLGPRGVSSFASRRGVEALWQRGTPRQLGWLHLLRRGLVWPAQRASCSWARGAGARAGSPPARLRRRAVHCHAHQAPPLAGDRLPSRAVSHRLSCRGEAPGSQTAGPPGVSA
jgi:transposase